MTGLAKPLTDIIRIMNQLMFQYQLDNYFSFNIVSLYHLVRVINEVSDEDIPEINADEIIQMIRSPKDLVKQIPIYIKSVNKGTTFRYSGKDNDEGEPSSMYGLKPNAIYRSVVYDICVKAGKTAPICDLFTNGIISFKHVLSHVKRAADEVKINGTFEDVMTINTLIGICSDKISTEEAFKNE